MLSGLCQGICEKQLDRVTFIEALAAQIGVEVPTRFERIEPLALKDDPPRDQSQPAPRARTRLRVPVLMLPRRPLTDVIAYAAFSSVNSSPSALTVSPGPYGS